MLLRGEKRDVKAVKNTISRFWEFVKVE